MNYVNRFLCCLVSLCCSSAFSYVLRSDFYMLNLCSNKIEVKYNSCLYKTVDGYSGVLCEDDSVILNPKEAKRFKVDSEDNNFTDDKNYYNREIYVYQVISQNSSGLFLRDKEDRDQYRKDYKNNPEKSHISFCVAQYNQSVILNDYGSDTIYCYHENR